MRKRRRRKEQDEEMEKRKKERKEGEKTVEEIKAYHQKEGKKRTGRNEGGDETTEQVG